MTLFVKLCARYEGFGKPGAVPTRDNNPMDLRHSPHSSHAGEDPDGIGEIDTVADGWADAERQAALWASRGLTIKQAVEQFLAPANENNPTAYLNFLIVNFGGRIDAGTQMSQVLEILA